MDGVAATSVVHGTCIAGTCISTTRIPTTRISSGRMMKRAGLSRGHDSGLVECSRLGSSSDSRLATINRGTQLWIRAGFLYVLPLWCYRGHTACMCSRLFLGGGPRVYAAVSAVVADTRPVANIDTLLVDVVNDGDIHVINGAIVKKTIAFPTPAVIAAAEVTVTIIDAAVEADRFIGPESFVENKTAAAPSPISRSPQETDFRSQHPSAWNPVIVIVIGIPGPEAGSPDIAIAGANRLFVNREIRRRKPDGDTYGDLCGR